ncbi:MAG: hypothetical protein CVV24_00825 [Ignavibacteriae bacterium HGW-Ignavibacteriae-3]|nr:MAG: hypothetical protein CVV24_00825 [Ignavibacteriae bacterium HGW-Ignavibacteriae-3]
MKPFIKIAAHFLLPAYFAGSLILLSHCSLKNDHSIADRINSSKQNKANLLLQKFNAEIFDINSSKILNHTVVMDTLLLGVFRKNGDSYLRAGIKADGNKKYYAELECSPEILESYYKIKSGSVLIAARINRIDNCDVIAEADSLDGETLQYSLGKSVLLSGECLAIAEIPSIINAD